MCGLRQYLDVILTRDDVEHSKPDPEIYCKCLERLKLGPKQCLVIEDSAIGIQAAKGAEALVAARRDERYFTDQSEADFSIDGMEDILQLLQRIED